MKQVRALLEFEYKSWKQTGDGLVFVQATSVLLRRLVLSFSPREKVAGLVGDDWLRLLDAGLEGRPFQQGVGLILQDGPYRKEIADSMDDLYLLCQKKINQLESSVN